MPEEIQRQEFDTIVIPELGLEFIPKNVNKAFVDNVFMRTLSYIFGKSSNGPIFLEATSSGILKVAVTGSGYETIQVETGDASDTYAAGDTFEVTTPFERIYLLIEQNPATVSIKDRNGNWSTGINVNVGVWTRDIIAFGVKIQNRIPGLITTYQFEGYL